MEPVPPPTDEASLMANLRVMSAGLQKSTDEIVEDARKLARGEAIDPRYREVSGYFFTLVALLTGFGATQDVLLAKTRELAQALRDALDRGSISFAAIGAHVIASLRAREANAGYLGTYEATEVHGAMRYLQVTISAVYRQERVAEIEAAARTLASHTEVVALLQRTLDWAAEDEAELSAEPA